MNKILINKTNGQILVATKIMRSDDKVAYVLYDNGIAYSKNVAVMSGAEPFSRIMVPDVPMNLDNLFEFLAEEALKARFPGFEPSESAENWAHETGSTGNPTLVRVCFPHELLGKVLGSGEPLDLLVQAMIPLFPKATRGDVASVQYLEELLPEHRQILEAYASLGVVIEDKQAYHTLLFKVTDQAVPVEGVTVHIQESDYITDANGEIVFDTYPGTFPYIVTFPDATTQEGSVTVTSSDVTVEITK